MDVTIVRGKMKGLRKETCLKVETFRWTGLS
jgi:hypothetical protein